MKVLIACEESDVMRSAFERLGWDAWSCDLVPSRNPNNTKHLQCDVLSVLDNGWDLIIAHPPCDYLTSSAEWAYKEPPYHQKLKLGTLFGFERVKARIEAIGFVKKIWNAKCKRVVIENPIGCLSKAIGKPTQIVQPHWFGDDASKATCLWMKTVKPLRPTKSIPPRLVCCGKTLAPGLGKYGCPNCCGDKVARPRWGNQTDSGQNKLPPSKNRKRDRSATYPGLAEAMAKQITQQIKNQGDWI